MADPEITIEPEAELESLHTSDTDSTRGDDLSSYTTSVSSSILRYPVENGRRYHKYQEGSYPLPNDEKENDRLDLMHYMIMTLFDDKLHEAPIGEHPQRIIDVGTGTGIWAIEMGDKYPSAQIIGNDLSAEQPREVPPNVKFEIDDVELEWTHNEPFDYIHCRYMCACIKNWPKLVRTCYEHLKPGGYVEFKDFDLQYYSEDNTYTDDLACARYISLILQGANMTGKDPCPGRNLEKWVRDAGFEDVHHKLVKVPLGPWPADSKLKTVGLLSRTQRLEGLEAFALAFLTRQLHWEVEEVQILVAKVRKDFLNPRIHGLYDLHMVYGRKPGKVA